MMLRFTAILLIVTTFGITGCTILTKKYTLRIPYGAPMTSRIIAIGGICAKAAEVIIDKVNRQSNLLPDYNVIVDMYDGQCSAPVSVRKSLDMFQRTEKEMKPSNTPFGDFVLPANASFSHKSAEIAMVPPISNGPFCSETCPPYSHLTTFFNRINMPGLCNDMSLDNGWTRNTYRYGVANDDIRLARAMLAKMYKWNKVATLSTTDSYSYSEMKILMQELQRNNISIIAEEFVLDDPRTSVQRLKATGARILFATCYATNCPTLGCAIAEEAYYGPSVVWVFGTLAEFINPRPQFVPKWCNLEKLRHFAESVFRIRQTRLDKSVEIAEIGITQAELFGNLKKTLPPKVLQSPLMQYAATCFDHFQSTIFILDNVEKQLKKENSTLANYLSVQGFKDSNLLDMFRDSAQKLDIVGFLGKSILEANTKRAVGHDIDLHQYIDGASQIVFSYNLRSSVLRKKADVKWLTLDGSVPKDRPQEVTVYPTVPSWLLNLVRTIVAGIFCGYLAAFVAMLVLRRNEKLVNAFIWMKLLSIVGIMLILAAILIYPDNQEMETFCMSAPGLLTLGYTLLMGGFVFGIFTPFFFSIRGRISEHKRVQIAVVGIFVIWIIVNAGCVIALYANNAGGSFTEVITEIDMGGNDFWKADLITTSIWLKCVVRNDYYLGMVLLGLQGLLSFVGMLAALISKNHKHFQRVISDIAAARLCIYIIFPVSVALMMAFFTLNGYLVVFGVIACYAIIIPVSLLAFYIGYILKYDPTYVAPKPTRTTKFRSTAAALTSVRN